MMAAADGLASPHPARDQEDLFPWYQSAIEEIVSRGPN